MNNLSRHRSATGPVFRRAACALLALVGAIGAVSEARSAEFETGSIGLNRTIDSGGNDAWKQVNLQATYASPPVVVAGPLTHDNDYSLSVRVRNVTTTDFEIAMTSPCDSADADPNAAGNDCPPPSPGNSPPWNTEEVRYLVVPQGQWIFPDGTKIEAARESVSAVRSNEDELAGGDSDAGESVSFQYDYTSRPVVLHTANTTNDADWITTSVFGPGNAIGTPPDKESFTLALEGAEVTNSHGTETVGWIAIERANGTNNGNRYVAGVSSGLDTDRHDDGCFDQGGSFGFGAVPDVVVGHNTMQGSNGAWTRYCGNAIERDQVNIHVDEDQVNDGERGGIPEATSWFAFAADGIGKLVAPPADPILDYRMDEDAWSGSGSVTDETGNGRDGSPIGGASPADSDPAIGGNPGTCGYGTFDGSDDGVEDGDAGSYLSGLSQVTVTAWVYNTDDLSGNDRGIFFTDEPVQNPAKDFRLGMRYDVQGFNRAQEGENSDNVIKASVHTTACNAGEDCVQVETEPDVMVQNQWQHVAMTWESGGDLRVYVDGVDVTDKGIGDEGQGTGGTIDQINGLRIAQGSQDERWQGRIDEFRMYDEALSAAQVQAVRDDTHPCTLGPGTVQAGQVTLNDTASDPSFKEVCFDQTMSSTPVIFTVPTDTGGDPLALRIRNVTTSGFEIAQVEPPGEDGPAPAQTVDFIAIAPGTYNLFNNTQAVVGSVSTQRYQSGLSGGTGWETVNFASSFASAPAVLGQIQTMNNESGSPPGNPSVPWLTTTVDAVQTDQFDIALERSEVDDGSVGSNERIGYMAIEPSASGPLTDAIDFESIATAENIRGYDDGCFSTAFNESYSSTPLAIATKTTRNGGNGGWLRRCSLDTAGVGLQVDEDQDNDSDRAHTDEAAGVLVLSGSFGTHDCPTTGVDHYAVLDPGDGVTCEALPVTIEARDSSDNPTQPASGTTIDVFATKGKNTTDPAPDSSWASSGTDQTSYTFGGSSASVTLDLRRTSKGQVNVDVDDGTATESSSDDPNIDFLESGFLFYADGSAGAIGNQIADKPSDTNPGKQSLELRAVEDPNGSNPGEACEARLGDGQTIEMAFECRDPSSCSGSRNVAINGTDIDANDSGSVNSYADVTLDFGSDGRAPFTLEYPDAGKIRLHAREQLSASGDDPAITLTGESNDFVVRPFGFFVEAPGNPGATNASQGDFTDAAADFTVEATAVGWASGDDDATASDPDGVPDGYGNNDPTDNVDLSNNVALPNFSAESGDDAVTLTDSRLWKPSGGNDPGLAGSTVIAEATFQDGSDVGEGAGSTTVNYPEVGIIELRAKIEGGDYLGAGNVSGRSGAVGRFIPAYFEQTVDSDGTFEAVHGSFTYTGQRFGYATGAEPALTITAFNDGGTKTRNYTGNFAKLAASDIQRSAPSQDDNQGGADGNGNLPVTASLNTGTLTDNGDGTLTYDFATAEANDPNDPSQPASDVDAYTYDRDVDRDNNDRNDARVGNFNAELTITIDDITDSDGVTATTLNDVNPSPVEIRFGRLIVENAVGAEIAEIAQPFRVEYWTGDTWQVNAADSSTALKLGDSDNEVHMSNDQDGDSPVDGDGSIDVGSGTTSIDETGSVSLSNGELELTFNPPGSGNTGWVDTTAILGGQDHPYLRTDPDDDGVWDADPTGRVTFGVYEGNPNWIHLRRVR